MIATLWRKHRMELRGIWAFMIAMLSLVARMAEGVASPVQVFIAFSALIVVGLLSARFAGTGLATSPGTRPHRGADPSLAFTLSLPVRRRTLFFYRTGFCLLAMESAAMLGLVMGTVVYAHSGRSMLVFTDGWRILFLAVPLYFLDSLLSIRFDAFSVMQVQILVAMGLWFALPLAGVKPEKVVAMLSGIAPIPFALLTLLIAAGLAAVTVWRLDRHDY